MEIKDIRPQQGNIDLVLEVVDKDEPRMFEKFGKQGQVCNAKVKDETGEISLTLWNDDIDRINVGDKIHLQNGWCSEFRGEKQLSAGKFGKIEVIEQGQKEVFTNSPEMLQGALPQADGGETTEAAAEEQDLQLFDEEEMVE